jgi:UDP-glucose 4-epimerase
VKRDSILLLGGNGFIGQALTRRLVAQGKRVHIISRTTATGMDQNAIVHVGSLGDTALLKKLQSECNVVVHLASITTPGLSAAHPAKELDNLMPTLHLLETLQDWHDTHLIFLSSGGTVYGNPVQNPVAENAQLAPLSYHGAGKVAAEGFLGILRANGLPVTVLRPSNAYGPGQNLNQGFGLIRTVLEHILRGSAMEIWGDGENVRDFIYIDDIVQAVLLAINAPDNNATYNVGSGKGYTLNHVLEQAQKICGAPIRVNYHPARNVDVREVVLDVSRIRSSLGWQPHVGLEQGLYLTYEWLQNRS